MRRRISFAILGTLAVALLLVGVGTLLLSRVNAQRDTETGLRSEAEGLVELVPSLVRGNRPLAKANRGRVEQKLRLQGIGFVTIDASGAITGRDLPAGVHADDVKVQTLISGSTVSGAHGKVAWAMASRTNSLTGPTQVIVLTRDVQNRTRGAGWFLVSSGVVLLLGAAVAWWLSRTLTLPLRLADDATRRLTTGDLSARVPEPSPRAHDELAALARSINAMAETMERSRGLERQFLLSVSHDLRTPLTSIRGYAEALTDGTITDQNRAGTVILGEARRLERLVRDLLELATVESRQFTLRTERVAVTDLVAGSAEGFSPQLSADGLVLVVDPDPTRASAVVDPDRFGQVLANLMENAARYAATTVRLSVVAEASNVAVRVADDGPGIADADLPHVFERLYVAHHRPAGKESGSGLGLAIVRELVTAMGGTATAEAPEPGTTGARLVIRFPRA